MDDKCKTCIYSYPSVNCMHCKESNYRNYKAKDKTSKKDDNMKNTIDSNIYIALLDDTYEDTPIIVIAKNKTKAKEKVFDYYNKIYLKKDIIIYSIKDILSLSNYKNIGEIPLC